MINVLMVTPNATDGVSLYRHWGPMIELEKQGKVKLIPGPENEHIKHWQYYKKSDVAFVSRPYRLWDQAVLTECDKHGIPVWIDMDDNCFCIPDDNDAFTTFSETAKKVLTGCLERSRIITVATKRLSEYLGGKSEGNQKIKIIENALANSDIRLRKPFNNNNKIVWRGSKAGQAALMYYAPAFVNIIKENHDNDFLFLGLNPFFISRQLQDFKNIRWEPPINFIDYLMGLTQINPSFAVMTHLNTEFDQTKSINGFLESTLAGSVCLVPDIGQWQDIPNNLVFKYKCMDLQDFYYKFDRMIHTPPSKLKEMNDNSCYLIKSKYLLNDINIKRLNILEELLKY